MIAPVSSLANMEMQLYGGYGTNSNAPSYLNGYNANSYNSMPMFNGYGSMDGSTFGQNIPYNYGAMSQPQSQVAQSSQASAFQGLSKKESDAIVNYYAKGLSPTETLLAAGSGQAIFSIIEHPRLLVHPFNSFTTIKGVEQMFKGIKDPASALGKLWADPQSRDLLREAYMQTHKAEARLKGKLGLFRKTYSTKVNGKLVENEQIRSLINEMKDALSKGNKDKIAETTAKLQQAYISDGAINRGWNSVKNVFTGNKSGVLTVKDALGDKAAIAAKKAELLAEVPTDYKNCLKKAQGGVWGPLIFFGMEFMMGMSKIKAAFAKDKENAQNGDSTNLGWKQLGQTTLKGAGNAAGWIAGEAAGMYAFSKWGAKIGQVLGGGAGSALGRVIPLIGAGVAMCLTGKVIKAIVGQDVGDKVEAENLAKTQEGQAQLLQYTVQQAQGGKAVPQDVQQAVSKLAMQYA